MSREREEHPCLNKDKLELAHRLLGKETNIKPKIEKHLKNLCQSCRTRPITKMLKTKDKLTIHLCDECFERHQQEQDEK